MGLSHSLYACQVTHARLRPKRHAFRYGMFWFYLDLNELESLSALKLVQWGVYRFNPADHLPDGSTDDLSTRIRRYFAEGGLHPERLTMLTHLRTLGYGFNPLTVIYGWSATGEPLGALAEVENTFYEVKPYLLPFDPATQRFRARLPKHFYVSPYSSVQSDFDFNIGLPEDHLRLTIDTLSGEDTILNSAVFGEQRPLTDGELWRQTLRNPAMTLKVIGGIHWEALKLFLKGIPFYHKDADSHHQQGVLRPRSHRALRSKTHPCC
jgi:DUF1365 family protein